MTSSWSSVQRVAVISGLVAVAAIHSFVVFALDRGRVVANWSPSDFDFVVFLLPALLAFFAYLVLLARVVKRIGLRLGLAVLFAFLSGWTSLIVAFNTYGT